MVSDVNVETQCMLMAEEFAGMKLWGYTELVLVPYIWVTLLTLLFLYSWECPAVPMAFIVVKQPYALTGNCTFPADNSGSVRKVDGCFKERLRELGGLDTVCDLAAGCLRNIRVCSSGLGCPLCFVVYLKQFCSFVLKFIS